MSIRKRRWMTRRGVEKDAWIVEYVNEHGKRRGRTFKRKRFAAAFAAGKARKGKPDTPAADHDSTSVADAAELWLATISAVRLGPSTRNRHQQHVRLHIVPFLGTTRLSQLTVPLIQDFEAKLRANGRSDATVRKVVRCLGSILADAQARDQVSRNVVRELRSRRRPGSNRRGCIPPPLPRRGDTE